MWEPKYAVTIDFETYYSPDYTLSKLTTADYVRDARFETIGVGVKLGDEATRWLEDSAFRRFARAFPWREAGVLAHHTHFDGLILAYHYGVVPGVWFDTLSMARAIHGANVGGSLAKLAKHYQLGEKGTEVVKALGKRRRDFTPDDWAQYGEYCKNDVELTLGLFRAMCRSGFPESEMWLIDTTIRMFTEPSICLDVALLREALAFEKSKKAALLARCQADKDVLMSNEKFAALLLEVGAEVPRKISPRTGQETWALAKSDSGFKALLESDKDEVRWLAEARVGVKSTINETRTERFLKSGAGGRPLPVYLKFGAAHTFRWGGGDKMNFQNLERVDKKKPEKGVLRRAMMAPKGHAFVVADSAQIEARVLAWLAGQEDLLEAFRQGRDVYSEFASKAYGRPVDRKKNPDDFIPGFVGKACVLGLGFGMGWFKFAQTMLAGALGGPPVVFGKELLQGLGLDDDKKERLADMPTRLSPEALETHCAVAEEFVFAYRKANPAIVRFWKQAERLLGSMASGVELPFGPGGCCRTVRHGVVLPSGLVMKYPGLEYDDGYTYLAGHSGKERTKAYGGSVTENLVQALARQIVAEQMQRMRFECGFHVALMTHDEVVLVVPERDSTAALKACIDIMKTAPLWAAGCPLSAEGGIGQRYGEAK